MGIRRILFFLFFPVTAAFCHQTNVIPPVVVKARKHQRLQSTSADSTIITQDQIARAGVKTLAETLQNLSGVQLQDTVGNGSQTAISMRGFGTNATSNTLLLVNGIPITQPDMAPPNLNAIPLADIQRIEVVAGSESVLYGDQAVGGIINIVTSETAQEKWMTSCDTGSYHQYRCALRFNQQLKQLNYFISANAERSDNYRQHNNYQQAFLSAGMNYFYNDGRLRLLLQLNNENMLYPGALSVAQVRQNRRQANNDTDFFTDTQGFIHASHQHNLNMLWQIKTDLSHRQMLGNGTLTFPFTQSRNITFLKSQLLGSIGTSRLIMGADAESDRYQLISMFGATKERQQKYSVFSLFTPFNNSPWLTTLGARAAQLNSALAQRSTVVNRAFVTTLGTAYALRQDTHFYLRRAESFRFPKADENAFAPPGVNGLRTQRGIAYETGLQFDRDEYNAKFAVYQLYLKDEISFDPTQTPLEPFGTNRNLPPTMRRGFSITGKTTLSKWTANGQYNYVNARFQNGINRGKRIPLVAENIIRMGLSYQATEQWQFYAEAIYTGNQYAANDDANVTGKIGGYTLYHLNAHYRIHQLDFACRINNVFNKQYYFYTVYQPSMNSESFYPAPERNIVFSANYHFG